MSETETERLFVKRIRQLEAKIAEIQMSIKQGLSDYLPLREADALKLQVASLAEALHDLEDRVKVIEQSRFVSKLVLLQLVVAAILVFLFWLLFRLVV